MNLNNQIQQITQKQVKIHRYFFDQRKTKIFLPNFIKYFKLLLTTMEIMSRINGLMDKGYKMTNFPCSFCTAVTFCKPGSELVNCPKCIKEYKPELEQENDEVEDQYEDFLKEYQKKTPSQAKSEQTSKKIGSKLIQGWTMLEQSCQQCNVPLMRSKQGQKICCGCDKDYEQVAKPPAKKNQMQEKSYDKPKEKSVEKKRQIKVEHSHNGQNRPQLIEEITEKALKFLSMRLDKAIQDNNLEDVGKILSMMKSARTL